MLFSKRLILVIAATALVLGGNMALAQPGYKIIATAELKEWLDQPDKPLLAFALSPIEFSTGHIPGSNCIPLELMDNYYKMPDELGTAIVFYCKEPGCGKSEFAARKALEMGYTNVYWYREGLQGWTGAGLPLNTTINILQKEEPAGISPQTLRQKLNGGEQVLLIDIRDKDSQKEFGAIPGKTLHYPFYRLHRLYKELPPNKKMVVYDISGKQAPVAIQYLLSVYFDPGNVTWLTGGIMNWKNSGYPVDTVE